MSSVSDQSLNCIYAAPASEAASRLLAEIQEGDPVLLLGCAVELARREHPELVRWVRAGACLYALDEDLKALGLQSPDSAVQRISYAEWVTLSEKFTTQTLWR